MSWLNNSFNSIKGQLSNLAQEVLAETAGPGDEDYRGAEINTKTALELLGETQQQKENLDRLCEQKDREIAALRKQISKLQTQNVSDTGGGGDLNESSGATHQTAVKSAASDEQQNVDDSWCWEPENALESPTAESLLVKIPLDNNATLSISPETMEQRIRQLEMDNKNLNGALEALDTQHGIEMHNVLELKNELQAELTEAIKVHEVFKQEQKERSKSSDAIIDKLGAECEELRGELNRNAEELAHMQTLLAKKDHDVGDLLARIEKADVQAQGDHNELQQRVEQLTKELEELKKTATAKEKKTSESSNSSSTGGKQSEDEFIVVRETDANSSGPTTPPTKEELRDKLVELESRVAELTLENGSLALKLQDRQLEKDLAQNVLKESYDILEQKYDAQSAELSAVQTQLMLAQERAYELGSRDDEDEEQVQLELQSLRTEFESKLQKLNLENQQLRLNAEAEQESLENSAELEEKLKVLADENDTLRNELDSTIAQAKFRQAIAEEKQEITDLDADAAMATATITAAADEAFDMSQLRALLSAIVNQDLADHKPEFIEKSYKALRLRLQKMETLEKSVRHMSKEISNLQEHKVRWAHEKKTLEADILQYVVQCEDLMKNNEILLNDLENIRHKKLETIHENNEETIVLLESQLEECTQLNRTLGEKHSVMATEQNSLATKLLELREEVDKYVAEETEWMQRVQTLEEERGHLLCELAELKSSQTQDDVVAELQEKCENLKAQLARMSKDHADLVGAMQTQEATLQDGNRKREVLLQELASLRAQLEAKETAAIQQAAAESAHLTALQEELNAKRFEVEQLRAHLAKTEAALEAGKEVAMRKAAQIKENAELYEALKTSCDRQAEELAALSANRTNETEATMRVAQLEAELLASAQSGKHVETLQNELAAVTVALHQKHAESQRYYQELQRLEQVVRATATEAAKPCDKCLTHEQNISGHAKEHEKLQDQINFLKEKSDILTTNLLTEQTNQKLLQQEKSEVEAQNLAVTKDLERLRAHLLEVEDLHTQETVELQRELDETKAKMSSLHDEVSKSSNAYTSANIRANQHAETLQAQYALVVQQRDELLAKLSWSEDRDSKNQAALINLQCALEQFQNDKEQDIKSATQRIRRELQVELDKETALQGELSALQQQLGDANQGLRAAARLSDQLESCQQSVAVLREEIENLKEQKGKLEQQLMTSESSQTDKIDKNLIKSLLIGYVVSGSGGDKQQVLRVISSVLDFTANESDKVGLNKQQGSWLGAILGGGGGAASGTVAGGAHSKDNLVQAFVQFLEQESQPQSQTQHFPALLSATEGGAGGGSRRTSIVSAPLAAAKMATAASTTTTTTATAAAAGYSASNATTPVPTAAMSTTYTPLAMQPMHLSSNEFAPTRNSSSILKNILSDS